MLNCRVIQMDEFVCEPAYRDMVAIEVAKLTRAAEEYKNFLKCSPEEALVKLKKEIPLHHARAWPCGYLSKQ